ncbi:hypothetical protein OsI_02562 [Oryza sativa Indica Group]|uniref:Uncharacterized protein n=1 Tax=Oryza sativa subsp. indica TaxID=39946 RepID=A2WRS1_ORYSI|nr:hypothetical protein OsI_02562 [Oryza sativa Indica Group]
MVPRVLLLSFSCTCLCSCFCFHESDKPVAVMVPKCGYIRKAVAAARGGITTTVEFDLSALSGGADAFDKAAHYGANFQLYVRNMAALLCASAFLDMQPPLARRPAASTRPRSRWQSRASWRLLGCGGTAAPAPASRSGLRLTQCHVVTYQLSPKLSPAPPAAAPEAAGDRLPQNPRAGGQGTARPRCAAPTPILSGLAAATEDGGGAVVATGNGRRAAAGSRRFGVGSVALAGQPGSHKAAAQLGSS